MAETFQREYLLRLPLPLAQLYSRAYNAKDARGRHDNTYYLFEAFLKLAAAPAAAVYLHEVQHGAARVPALDGLLAALALPSLGQWLAILRGLARHFGERADAAAHPLGHLWGQLTTPRRDLDGVLALYRRIKNGPDGEPAGDQSCSLLQLFDALVQYRNEVFGHGGPRFEAFYARDMGPLLFPAANEVLAEGTLHPLGPPGSRLVYLAEQRTLDEDRVEVGVRELTGLQGERAAPLILTAAQAQALLPNRVAVRWPGRPAPLRLDPLLVYREGELAEEVLFLNRDRYGRRVEYLSYTTGRTERDRSTAPALATLLSRVVGRTVSEADLEAFAEQSRAESPSVEMLLPRPAAGRLLGDYEVLAEIGRGGMGVVYLARQLSLGRLVAMKMLPGDLAGDEAALGRFRREVRHLARCEHPHIVKLLSSGALPDGRLYYTMEYVPGCDLEQVWREMSGNGRAPAAALGQSTWARAVLTASRKRREQTARSADPTASLTSAPTEATGTESAPYSAPVPPSPGPAHAAPAVLPLPPLPDLPDMADDPGGYVRRVMALVRDAALALQAVHEQGVIHRDVKPANLMLTPDGSRVVLMDFGLAKGQSLALTASQGGGFLGTWRYAAPEQLTAGTLKVGPAADVRALGVVLWELLTRRRLFAEAEDERQLAARVHEEDVPRVRSIDPSLDRDLEAVVARATERRAADRIPTAGRLAEYLQLLLEGKPVPVRTPGAWELAWRWARQHRLLVGATAAGLLLLVALALTTVLLRFEQRREDAIQSTLLESDMVAARLIANAMQERLAARMHLLEASATPELLAALLEEQGIAPDERKKLPALLRQVTDTAAKTNSAFSEVTVTDRNGVLLAALEGPKKIALSMPASKDHAHLSWRDWFSGHGDQVYDPERHYPPITARHVSDPYVSLQDNEFSISLSVPLFTDPKNKTGDVVGVLETGIKLDEINRWLLDVQISNGFVAVLDGRRYFVLHQRQESIRPPLPDRPPPPFDLGQLDQALAQGEPSGMLPSYHDPVDGHDYLAGFARMTDPDFDWVVLVQHDPAALTRAPTHPGN
jgi:serine/threonine protein kinase